jgi:chemotaxis response regulator CheB
MAVRILIADDHAVVADGMRHLLAAQPDLEVVGLAGDGAEAVRLARELRPDVVLLDIVMPHMNGIDAAREILRGDPRAGVIMLSMYSDSERVVQSLQAGARGIGGARPAPLAPHHRDLQGAPDAQARAERPAVARQVRRAPRAHSSGVTFFTPAD